MNKYYIDILRKKKYIPKLLNIIKQLVYKNQFGKYYWFARYKTSKRCKIRTKGLKGLLQ